MCLTESWLISFSCLSLKAPYSDLTADSSLSADCRTMRKSQTSLFNTDKKQTSIFLVMWKTALDRGHVTLRDLPFVFSDFYLKTFCLVSLRIQSRQRTILKTVYWAEKSHSASIQEFFLLKRIKPVGLIPQTVTKHVLLLIQNVKTQNFTWNFSVTQTYYRSCFDCPGIACRGILSVRGAPGVLHPSHSFRMKEAGGEVTFLNGRK